MINNNYAFIRMFEYQKQIDEELRDLIIQIQQKLTKANIFSQQHKQHKFHFELGIRQYGNKYSFFIEIRNISGYVASSVKNYDIKQEKMYISIGNYDEDDKYNEQKYNDFIKSINNIKKEINTINWVEILDKFADLQEKYSILGNINGVYYEFAKIIDDSVYYFDLNSLIIAIHENKWIRFSFNDLISKNQIKMPKNLDKLLILNGIERVSIHDNNLILNGISGYFKDFQKFINDTKYNKTLNILKKILDGSTYSHYQLELDINNIDSLIEIITNYNQWKKEH